MATSDFVFPTGRSRLNSPDNIPPTDQRAGVKPIAFILTNAGENVVPPVFLNIRPEELTRTEPARTSVHQTLGRENEGWIDHFGPGLPTINISGNTGWRLSQGTNFDGWQSYVMLNDLLSNLFPAERQKAIDQGRDPADVKLIFVDTLHNKAESVVPMNFTLRRSKSRPLFFQYQIPMQVVSTRLATYNRSEFNKLRPDLENPGNAILSLDFSYSVLEKRRATIQEDLLSVLKSYSDIAKGFAKSVRDFIGSAMAAIKAAQAKIRAAQNLATGLANEAIAVASDIAATGVALFRTLNSIANIPEFLKANLIAVAAAFNEVKCIFANSLKQRKVYEQYKGLYGASNCSSTTGGSPISPYAGVNPFNLMNPSAPTQYMSSAAIAASTSIQGADPLFSPLSIPTLYEKIQIVSTGITL